MNEIELEFTKLVREYRKTIYTVCYFFSDNPTYVDDLFQEVLNTCCKVERGKKRNVPTVPLLIDKDVLSESNEVGRQVKMLYDRINRLELFDRAIILLWLESMSYDEIAAIVGISTSAVTSRLFRIKEQLKSMSNH